MEYLISDLSEPSKQEYFYRLVIGSSVTNPLTSEKIRIVLFLHDNPQYSQGKSFGDYCSKVKKGDSLYDSIKRDLKIDFGVNEFTIMLLQDDGEAKDRKGNYLKRIVVEVLVPYFDVKGMKVVGKYMSWLPLNNNKS
jgi:hypothetical protein